MIRPLTQPEEALLEQYGFDNTVTQRIRDVWEMSTSSVLLPMRVPVLSQSRMISLFSTIIIILLTWNYLEENGMMVHLLRVSAGAIAILSIVSLPFADMAWQDNVAYNLSPTGIHFWGKTTLRWKIKTTIKNILIGVLLYYTGENIMYQIWALHTLIWLTAFHNMAKATGRSLLGENDKEINWLRNYSLKDPRISEGGVQVNSNPKTVITLVSSLFLYGGKMTL